MLRDSSLIPLSRQHHNGLALCVLSRRALRDDASQAGLAKVARGVIDRFDIELSNHFEIEEQVLFPVCGDLPIVAELVREHRVMEGIVDELRTAPSEEALERLFVLLTAHIRREERELFEKIQNALTREVLDQAGVEIERRVVKVCL
jgi:hemerythrin-like domain-containing protein